MFSFAHRKVLFVTTKNLDYLRNIQEIELIKQKSEKIEIVGSNSKNYFVRILKVYFKLLIINLKEFDTIFIGFAPQLVLPFWGWKFRNKSVMIDFFISLYDTFVFDRKKIKVNSVGSRVLKLFDCKTIQKADRVIVDTKQHGKYFIDELGLEKEKMQVLYLKADTSVYYPRKQEKPKRMTGKYVVLYFGSVLPLQGVQIILQAIALLMKNKDLYFVMIGPINEKYQKPIGENVEYHEWMSQEILADYISYADLCLAGHFNAEISKAKRTIPGKAYIYCAMNKPMILGNNPANREVFKEETDNVYYVEMGNPQALADKIMKIKELRW